MSNLEFLLNEIEKVRREVDEWQSKIKSRIKMLEEFLNKDGSNEY